MSRYDGAISSQIVQAHVEGILYSGRHGLQDRAANLIRLLIIIERVLEADGSIADLIFEAITHAYPSTEDHDRNLESFIVQTRKQANKELAKAKKGEQ
jgi:hypothetical protein